MERKQIWFNYCTNCRLFKVSKWHKSKFITSAVPLFFKVGKQIIIEMKYRIVLQPPLHKATEEKKKS